MYNEYLKEVSEINIRHGVVYAINCRVGYTGKVYKSYPDSNQNEWVRSYKDGLLDGVCIIFLKNGQMIENQQYINGKLNGVSEFFYKNGQVSKISNFENDIKHLYEIEYYFNGDVKCFGFYQNGKKEGVWKYYSDNGNGYIIKSNFNRYGCSKDCLVETIGKPVDIVEYKDGITI